MTKVIAYASLEDLPTGAQRLFEAAETQCFFCGLPWFRTFVRHALDAGDRLCVFSVGPEDERGTPQFLLPLLHRAQGSGFWRTRKLSALASYYTSLFGPIASGAISAQLTGALAQALAGASPSWDEIELRPLDLRSPEFGAMVEGMRNTGFVVQTFFCFGNWYLDVNGRNFEQYLSSLPPKLRNTLERKRKKLERSGRARIEIVQGGANLEAAIAAYSSVYRASWKKPEPYPEFVPQLMRACAASGSLRLGLVYVDGEPAAAQFWVTHNGTALIYKLAYDERFADLSAGTILTATLMQHAIDVDKVSEVDYLTGDDSYKKDWMSHRRERWGILAMNPHTVRGMLAIARHVGGRAVKRAVQSVVKRGAGLWKPAATGASSAS
jgi:CelD/BcsL family acetyltransferase involved in cellulose biosynthesis